MRRKDWADNRADEFYEILSQDKGDSHVVDEIAKALRQAHVHGMDEGATLARRNAFKHAFRGGFGRSVVPG